MPYLVKIKHETAGQWNEVAQPPFPAAILDFPILRECMEKTGSRGINAAF